MPEEFKNAGFTLIMHQMLKNATITGHFGFVVEKNSDREIILLS